MTESITAHAKNRCGMQQYCVDENAFGIDEIDARLLTELQRDADRPLYELGETVGLSASATSRRISRYKSQGIIERTVAVLSAASNQVAVHVLCHITCRTDDAADLGRLKTELTQLDEVVHCYEIAGVYDLIAVFAVKDMPHYIAITDEFIRERHQVERFESHVVLQVVKTTSERPV